MVLTLKPEIPPLMLGETRSRSRLAHLLELKCNLTNLRPRMNSMIHLTSMDFKVLKNLNSILAAPERKMGGKADETMMKISRKSEAILIMRAGPI